MLFVVIGLVFVISCEAGVFNRGGDSYGKLSMVLEMKEEEIAQLNSELRDFRTSTRILSDQVAFYRGNINYHKRIAMEAMKEKVNVKRTLLDQLEALENKHIEDLAAVKAEEAVKIKEAVRTALQNFEEEKQQLITDLKLDHAREIKEIKKEFRQQLAKSEETAEAEIAELKARLREEKVKTAKRSSEQERDVGELRQALSAATSSRKQEPPVSTSPAPPRRSRDSKRNR